MPETERELWMERVCAVPPWTSLLAGAAERQEQEGYYHTLREILQQPHTWRDTAALALAHREVLGECLAGARAIAITGSGSSYYAAACLAPALQKRLGIPCAAVPAGDLVLAGAAALPPLRPLLLVSLARSGDSPESCAVVEALLDSEPACRHLLITCNPRGKLATSFGGEARVRSLVLDERTCDRSLVMTSSFTNMVVAGSLLGLLGDPERYAANAGRLAALCEDLIVHHGAAIEQTARADVRSAVYLGSGCRNGAACEAALKMTEMTGGQVRAFAETYLGLRHGPLAAVHADTLVAGFLSSDPFLRAYEADLIEELHAKQPAASRVLLGDGIPKGLGHSGDTLLECPGLAALADDDVAVLDVVAAQLLAFFRCRALGFRPDQPSDSGVITRVVGSFRMHPRTQSVTP